MFVGSIAQWRCGGKNLSDRCKFGEMGKHSIFVKGYSEATSAADLRELFGKIVHVESVYEPDSTPTGLRRRFMIMKVDAPEEEVAKCAKKLNNCLWKGGTLCVEQATEHFDRRIEREHREEEEEAEKLRLESEEAVQPLPAFDRDHIRLKKAIGERGVGHHVCVSTEQLMRKSNQKAYIMRGENKNEVLSCGRRLVFEYHEDGSMTERQIDAWGNDVFEEDENLIGATIGETSNDGEIKKPDLPAPSAPGGMTAPPSVGTGVRKGFGTLLPQLKVAKASTKESSEEFQSIMDDADSHFAANVVRRGGGAGRGRDVNDLIQENEFNEADMIEIVRDETEEEVHVPSATADELQSDHLTGARDKAMQMALTMLNRGDGGAFGEQGASGVTHDADAQFKKERVFKGGWDSTTIAHFDPSNPDSAALYLMDEEEAEGVRNKVLALREAKDAARRDKERGKDGGVTSEGRGDIGQAEAAETDLGALKSIFLKDDGGVWFGDTGTDLKTTANKGDATADQIFREAEKFGFDVRDPKAGSESAGMTFGFFDSGEAATASSASSSSNSSSLAASRGENGQVESNKSSDTVSVPFESVEEDSGKERESDRDEGSGAAGLSPSGDAATAISTPKIFNLVEVAHQAKRFRRDDQISEQALVSQWQESREKASADYRRRKKDAKRRSEKYNLQNHRFSAQPQAHSAINGKVRARGGRKHRKK